MTCGSMLPLYMAEMLSLCCAPAPECCLFVQIETKPLSQDGRGPRGVTTAFTHIPRYSHHHRSDIGIYLLLSHFSYITSSCEVEEVEIIYTIIVQYVCRSYSF